MIWMFTCTWRTQSSTLSPSELIWLWKTYGQSDFYGIQITLTKFKLVIIRNNWSSQKNSLVNMVLSLESPCMFKMFPSSNTPELNWSELNMHSFPVISRVVMATSLTAASRARAVPGPLIPARLLCITRTMTTDRHPDAPTATATPMDIGEDSGL